MDYSAFNIAPCLSWSQAHSVILACEYARQEEIDNDKVLRDAILSIEKEMQDLQDVVIPLERRKPKR